MSRHREHVNASRGIEDAAHDDERPTQSSAVSASAVPPIGDVGQTVGPQPRDTDAPVESPVLTVDEFATLLRVNRKSAYAAIQRGEIPGVRRIGRVVRINRATVVAWLATGQGAAPRSRRSP